MITFIPTRETTFNDVNGIMHTVRTAIATILDGEENIEGISVKEWVKKQEEKYGILIRKTDETKGNDNNDKSI